MTVNQQEESTQGYIMCKKTKQRRCNSRQNRTIQAQHSAGTAGCSSVGDRWDWEIPVFPIYCSRYIGEVCIAVRMYANDAA